jgi:hypothetical protein
MGHATVDMASHYATATITQMVDMANVVQDTSDVTTVLRVIKAGESCVINQKGG